MVLKQRLYSRRTLRSTTPNYDQGVDAYWLDETDGEGTGGGGDGDYGYNTSYGPPNAYSQLWVNDWLSMYVTRYATATACKY